MIAHGADDVLLEDLGKLDADGQGKFSFFPAFVLIPLRL